MKYHNFSETMFQLSDGKLIVTEDGHDCYRDYYGCLGRYGETQTMLYGSAETLSALIEHRYGIKPGKNIRQLGEMILFFPTKTGLTGAIASATWKTEHWYIGAMDKLVCMTICDKIPADKLARFSASFGSYNHCGSLPENPLLIYHYGKLYLPQYDEACGCFWLQDISDKSWRPSANANEEKLPF